MISSGKSKLSGILKGVVPSSNTFWFTLILVEEGSAVANGTCSSRKLSRRKSFTGDGSWSLIIFGCFSGISGFKSVWGGASSSSRVVSSKLADADVPSPGLQYERWNVSFEVLLKISRHPGHEILIESKWKNNYTNYV